MSYIRSLHHEVTLYGVPDTDLLGSMLDLDIQY